MFFERLLQEKNRIWQASLVVELRRLCGLLIAMPFKSTHTKGKSCGR
jgi:hypothetical protein